MAAFTHRHLYLGAALLWGVPGVILTIRGVSAYAMLQFSHQWWLLFITVAVIAAFYIMFGRIVRRYTARIARLPAEKISLWQTFPRRGWLLMAFMVVLGVVLRLVPALPLEFYASFYSGLGPMLLFAAMRFALCAWR